ncbi:hypothetical protein BDR26DRAFT_893869 [Obelidium mucronatum]|nr:hypothetical protein BDR26DRAFT_893869 [Obelidium mucronatum]
MHLPTLVVALLLQLSVATATLYEPADGKIIFGAWVDSEDALAAGNIGVVGDSPAAFNRRLGKNAGVFHLSQTLPLGVSPFTAAGRDGERDAVYPNQTDPNSFDLYTDADITKLAYQLDSLTNPLRSSRRVMLRFAPEMNGNWFRYGQQPARFVKDLLQIVCLSCGHPNAANLYPFGDKTTPNVERPALDTNKNGVLDYDDDPFTPYWPGTDYVDWVGISMYWKGDYSKDTPPHDNSASPVDYWEQMVQGGGSSWIQPKVSIL